MRKMPFNVFPCLKAGDFCHRLEREYPLTEANVLARKLKQRCSNFLIPCGDVTLANRGNHVSTSSIRRSKAYGQVGLRELAGAGRSDGGQACRASSPKSNFISAVRGR